MAVPTIHQLIRGKKPKQNGWIGGILCFLHPDNTPSASIHVEKQLLYCHACSKVYSWETGQTAVQDSPFKGIDEVVDKEPDRPVTLQYRQGHFPHWMFERGFAPQIMAEWGLGTININDLFIPIHNSNGIPVGWQVRKYEGKPKYYNAPGFKMHNVLFGLDRFKRSGFEIVYVVEGALDCMWLWQHNLPAVATLGSSISAVQLDLLLRSGPYSIITCVDNDEVGFAFGLRLRRALRHKVPFLGYLKLGKFKDVQDIADSQELKRVCTDIYT